MHPIAAAAESSFPVAWEAQAAQDPGWPGGPSLAVTAAFSAIASAYKAPP